MKFTIKRVRWRQIDNDIIKKYKLKDISKEEWIFNYEIKISNLQYLTILNRTLWDIIINWTELTIYDDYLE